MLLESTKLDSKNSRNLTIPTKQHLKDSKILLSIVIKKVYKVLHFWSARF
ncbi:hypothetical protein [Helicobacter cinaedi]|nr:hypothetical protein [Helicobacter cinaedi]